MTTRKSLIPYALSLEQESNLPCINLDYKNLIMKYTLQAQESYTKGLDAIIGEN